MLTVSLYKKILSEGLLNQVPEGIHTYYNVSKRRFENHKSPFKSNQNLVLAPCTYNMNGKIWKEFYSSLNDKELELTQSYPYKRGFIGYLKEIGLYDRYELARERVIEREFLNWAQTHNIDLTPTA